MAVNQFPSFKAFVLNQPPLVVFTACIFLFGITTISLAYIVGKSDLPNPDISMDWNVFIEHLTERHLCVHSRNLTEYNRFQKKSKQNALPNSTTNSTVPASQEPLIGVEQLSLSELLPDISSLKREKTQSGPAINVTKSMIVPVRFDSGLLKLPPYVTWLRGHVTGRLVGYTGQLAKETIHVNMFLPNSLRKCAEKPDCHTALEVCMVFFGPSSVIPKTRQFGGCRHWTDDVRHAANTTWFLPDYVPKQCTGKPQMKIDFNRNPSLTSMLSNIDKAIVIRHLLHTSYLIFIIVITMLFYALMRSHVKGSKILSFERVNV